MLAIILFNQIVYVFFAIWLFTFIYATETNSLHKIIISSNIEQQMNLAGLIFNMC